MPLLRKFAHPISAPRRRRRRRRRITPALSYSPPSTRPPAMAAPSLFAPLLSSASWGDLVEEEVAQDEGRRARERELALLAEDSKDGINLMMKTVRGAWRVWGWAGVGVWEGGAGRRQEEREGGRSERARRRHRGRESRRTRTTTCWHWWLGAAGVTPTY